MRLDYLDTYNDYTLGPVQQDEALFLHGLARMIRPQCVLEIGCLIGQSLRVWLNAGVKNIYCIDAVISEELKQIQEEWSTKKDGAILHFYERDMKKQIDFFFGVPDFVFIDASHRLEDNQAAVQWIAPHLKPGAIIAFHDTGHWADKDMTPDRQQFIDQFGGYYSEELQAWVHHPGEKETITWMSKAYKWHRLDLWATATARYGITLFQVPNK